VPLGAKVAPLSGDPLIFPFVAQTLEAGGLRRRATAGDEAERLILAQNRAQFEQLGNLGRQLGIRCFHEVSCAP
jgi:hypothetical protein